MDGLGFCGVIIEGDNLTSNGVIYCRFFPTEKVYFLACVRMVVSFVSATTFCAQTETANPGSFNGLMMTGNNSVLLKTFFDYGDKRKGSEATLKEADSPL
jgi:hypothetical protein